MLYSVIMISYVLVCTCMHEQKLKDNSCTIWKDLVISPWSLSLRITCFPPLPHPPVLHKPVILAVWCCSITHSQHSMIQLSTATARFIVYTIFVELEGPVCCINCHRDGSHSSNSNLQGCFVFTCNIHETSVISANRWCIKVASTILKEIFLQIKEINKMRESGR